MNMRKDHTALWRYLTDFWTLVAFAAVALDFFEKGSLESILGPVLAIYVAVLAIFSAEKEFERWHWRGSGKHMGEIYVWLWTLLIVGMLGFSYWAGGEYAVREHVFSTYIAVLGILAITRKSKEMFREIKKEEKGLD